MATANDLWRPLTLRFCPVCRVLAKRSGRYCKRAVAIARERSLMAVSRGPVPASCLARLAGPVLGDGPIVLASAGCRIGVTAVGSRVVAGAADQVLVVVIAVGGLGREWQGDAERGAFAGHRADPAGTAVSCHQGSDDRQAK